MNNSGTAIPREFLALVEAIPEIGFQRHAATLIENARLNQTESKKKIKELVPLVGMKAASGIVISAGPSLQRRSIIHRIQKTNNSGSIICVDGAYIACLRAGLIPDFVMMLDPHPTRPVRWFGDPDFEAHTANDDYFARQDLDLDFRKNSIEHNQRNIEMVNAYATASKMIISSCSASNVVKRLREAEFDQYWYNPLVDDPHQPGSLTRQLHQINGLPCLNTGGTVGTAAWVFAATFLHLPLIAVVGMDFGYYRERPLQETQTYFELVNRLGSEEGIENYFVEYEFPLTGERYYTDPTYFWYRQNFLELIPKASETVTINCTEGGTLVDESVPCLLLDEFLTRG